MAECQPQPTYPLVECRQFNRVHVAEGIAATVLAAAVVTTAAGVGWLIIQLPNRLQKMEGDISRVLEGQERLAQRFIELEKEVEDHDRRIIKLELRR